MITLVLGGTRSGKSAVAERLASARGPEVTYCATALLGADPDLAQRVAAHRARRPATWTTIECGADLAGALRASTGTVLVDSLGPWVAGWTPIATGTDELCAALSQRRGDTVVVSEEVGLAVHPATPAGRAFADALGEVNQAVAHIAEVVLLVVAGRVLTLPASEH